MIEQLMSVFGPAMEVVASAIGSRDERLARRHDRVRDDVVRALRAIYFTPEGLRNVLQVMANGDLPSEDAFRAALVDFNDAEWVVERALHRIEFEMLGHRRELSLQAAEQLDRLRYGKVNVRRDVQRALNEPLTNGQAVDSNVAAELLSKINALNALIIALEEEHNYRAHER